MKAGFFMKKARLLGLCILLTCLLSACNASDADNENKSNNESDLSQSINVEEEYIPDSNYIVTISEETIEIDGLKNVYTFLYLTDNHMVIKSDTDSQEVMDYADSLTGFTNSAGVQSVDAFPYWIEYANTMEINALLLGGDILAYPSATGIEYMKQQLAVLQSSYVYTLGNHDWSFPWEYFTPKGYSDYKPLFNDFTSFLEFEDLIILAIDNSADQVEPSSLDAFLSYYNKAKPIILVMHVPLSTESVENKSITDWGYNISIGGSGRTPNETTVAFLDLLYDEESPVVCILDGHTHAYDKSLLSNGIVQIVGDEGYGGNGLLLTVEPME